MVLSGGEGDSSRWPRWAPGANRALKDPSLTVPQSHWSALTLSLTFLDINPVLAGAAALDGFLVFGDKF